MRGHYIPVRAEALELGNRAAYVRVEGSPSTIRFAIGGLFVLGLLALAHR
jgi:hypothetical protein